MLRAETPSRPQKRMKEFFPARKRLQGGYAPLRHFVITHDWTEFLLCLMEVQQHAECQRRPWTEGVFYSEPPRRHARHPQILLGPSGAGGRGTPQHQWPPSSPRVRA